jgi:hypothetical protein
MGGGVKRIAVLGSTGSIGQQTLEIGRIFSDRFRIVALGAGKNSSASWGVRQTVSYEALGLKPGEVARIRIAGKIANYNPDDSDAPAFNSASIPAAA